MSSTYANSTDMTDFSTLAVPGTTGIWFTDLLNVGDLSEVNLTMGLAYELVNPWGVLGLQFKPPASNESVWGVMTQLVYQGAGVTNAYSLSLGDVDASNGSILFGAIDTERYTGDLLSLDCYYTGGDDYRTVVTLASVQANSSSGLDTLAGGLPVSTGIWVGRPALNVPSELAFNMWEVAGAEYWSDLGAPTVPCSMKESEGSFTFRLASDEGPAVSVPMRSLVAPPSGLGDNCLFLVYNETNPRNYYLGEAFLQNVYAVFDLANMKFAVATPNPESTATNIVAFAGVSAPIPSTVAVSSQLTRAVSTTGSVTELPTTTGSFSAAAGFQSTSATSGITAADTPTSESTSEPDESNGTTNTTAIGVGVGVGVGGTALVAIGVVFFLMRRRSQKAAEPTYDSSATVGSPANGYPAPEPVKYFTELEPQNGLAELPPDGRPVEMSGTPYQQYQGGGAYMELPASDMTYYPNQATHDVNAWNQR